MSTIAIDTLTRATPADLNAAFTEFLRLDVANGDASKDTVCSYRGQVAAWTAWCRDQGIETSTATTDDVKHYRQCLIDRHCKPASIRWMLTIVRRFYEAARHAGLCSDNPAAGVKSPRVRQATEDFKYLSNEQLDNLLASVPNPEEASGPEKVKRLRNLLSLMMMALHGLRTVEVHRANVEDLLERGEHTALLVRGKTRDRVVYLRPDTVLWLKAYLEVRGQVPTDTSGTPVFAALGNRADRGRISRRHIRQITDHYLQLAGLKRPGISNHALRHTAGTLGYLYTRDLRAVQELLGHTDPRMTARYAHVVDMAERNPALSIPVKLGGRVSGRECDRS